MRNHDLRDEDFRDVCMMTYYDILDQDLPLRRHRSLWKYDNPFIELDVHVQPFIAHIEVKETEPKTHSK